MEEADNEGGVLGAEGLDVGPESFHSHWVLWKAYPADSLLPGATRFAFSNRERILFI